MPVFHTNTRSILTARISLSFSLFTALLLLFVSCNETASIVSSAVAKTNDELYKALEEAEPGDNITLANGIWNDVQIKVTASGTEDRPITLSAETAGEVFLQGKSNLELGGDYINVEGLTFTNGYSPSRAVIKFEVEDTVANHCIVRNCVIKDYNKAQRNMTDLWVLIKGRHNQLDQCYLAGKSNRGPTVRVDLEGNESINNYHRITNNHFGPRPPKGGPSAETIQIGNSYTSMCPSYTLVENNLFDECNGEVEVISSKTNFNEFRNNVFYKSEGSLVTRHGNYCTVDGNYFIGDDTESNVGGIRLIGTGHTVTNNYFYNLRGKAFRSPLAVMNGIPKSPQNRYTQVTDVTIAYNSWINCEQPLQFGVGSNVSMKDVLPKSEIRSARPKRTVVANNLIYNTKGDKTPVVAHDKLDGILFSGNLINEQDVDVTAQEGIETASFELTEIADYIMAPAAGYPEVELYEGFDFDKFDADLFGASRQNSNAVGALTGAPTSAPAILDRSNYGPDWFTAEDVAAEPITHKVAASGNIEEAIAKASDGDIITLDPGSYKVTSAIMLDKALTIMPVVPEATVRIEYTGASTTPLFEMNPSAALTLKGIQLMGSGSQYAFASLKKNMSSLYNLTVENCIIEGFDYVLKGYKYSFAEHIHFRKSTLRNCANGIELSEEIEDKGEYNAENLLIDGCMFEGIAANVVDYYRGGYDESTVGGNLHIINSPFTNCGAKEKNGILLNTYGIINVDISGNTFENNRVKQVAQLWGAKNNTHSNNAISNSGKIVTEENLKLKLLY